MLAHPGTAAFLFFMTIIAGKIPYCKREAGESLFKISSDGPNSVGFTNEQSITFKGWPDSLLYLAESIFVFYNDSYKNVSENFASIWVRTYYKGGYTL